MAETITKPMSQRVRHIIDLRSEGRTLQQVADELGVTRERIRQILVKGLGDSGSPVRYRDRPCQECGAVIVNAHAIRKFCDSCRREHLNKYQRAHQKKNAARAHQYRQGAEYCRVQIRYLLKKLDALEDKEVINDK